MYGLKALGLLAGLVAVKAVNYTNPIHMNGPDPFIVWDDDTQYYYFTYTTGNDLELTRAKTIDGLRANPHHSVRFSNESMIKAGTTWAPEIHKLWGKWYFHWSLKQRPFVVEIGESLTDDFNSSTPTQLSDEWGIDGTVLDLNDCYYYVWSCHRPFYAPSANSSYDNQPDVEHQSLCIAKFNSPTELDTSNIGVLSQPLELWEQYGFPVNEGPAPMYWQNETYLTYSASFCGTPDYALGILHYTGGDPLSNSSWVKNNQGPIFSSANGNYGTGHNGLFLSPDKTELWNVFHAVQNPKGGCDHTRATWVNKVNTTNFDPETGPIFTPIGFYGETPQGPSGEQEIPETIDNYHTCGYACWSDGGLGEL